MGLPIKNQHLTGTEVALPEVCQRAARPIKVLLIYPPTHGCVQSLLPQVDEGSEGIGYKPPLGVLYLATTLKRDTPHEVKVLDGVAQELDFETIVRAAVEFGADVVGISAWTDFWYPAFTVGKMIKEALPATHLVYGGPHLGVYPEATLEVPFVDSVVVGDGEIPLVALCNMIAAGEMVTGFPGLHLKKAGVSSGESWAYIQKDLDALPIPDRQLLPLELYTSVLGASDRITTMITSRGCPHRCVFCKLSFQKTLCRSAESIIGEFDELVRLDVREVEIYDDTFTWAKKRLRDICNGLIERDNQIKWAVRDRVSNATPELLELMYRAGCRRVHYGVESGVDRVLKTMGKAITTQQARDAVRWAKAAGMTVLTYFMFGNLDETVEDMRGTIDFALELDAHYCEFSITIPYAGTKMYEVGLERGLLTEDYWAKYASNPEKDFRVPQLIENHADRATLIELRDEAVRRFYFRPRYMLKQLVAVRSFGEFWRKAGMGLQLFSGLRNRSKHG